MSGLYVPSLAVDNARHDVGYHEGYNNYNKFSYWQYGSWYNPWCASAVSKWSYDAGFRFFGSSCGTKGEFNVGTFANWAMHNGLWRSRDTHSRPGWLIVLNFGMRYEHIEMVVSDNGGNVATIGGNTGNGVYYRTRYRGNIDGFIALDEAGQNSLVVPPQTAKVVTKMGMTAAAQLPGAKVHNSGPYKGRVAFIGAQLQPAGNTDLVGFNGCKIVGGKPFGNSSVFPLGKLNKPIISISPEVDKAGNWTGRMTGMAEDGGTFNVAVTSI